MLLCQTENQLAASKGQIVTLKKKMEKAEKAREQAKKARDQAEQEGYDIGMTETEEALRAKVLRVCRNYCLQVWNEALNQARVEVSSVLRKAESVYYPPTIRASSPASSRTGASLEVAEVGKTNLAKALASFNNPFEVAQQHEVAEKEADVDKGVAPDATKPPAAP